MIEDILIESILTTVVYVDLGLARLISSVCFIHIKQLLLLCLSYVCCRYSIKIIACACNVREDDKSIIGLLCSPSETEAIIMIIL